MKECSVKIQEGRKLHIKKIRGSIRTVAHRQVY